MINCNSLIKENKMITGTFTKIKTIKDEKNLYFNHSCFPFIKSIELDYLVDFSVCKDESENFTTVRLSFNGELKLNDLFLIKIDETQLIDVPVVTSQSTIITSFMSNVIFHYDALRINGLCIINIGYKPEEIGVPKLNALDNLDKKFELIIYFKVKNEAVLL